MIRTRYLAGISKSSKGKIPDPSLDFIGPFVFPSKGARDVNYLLGIWLTKPDIPS